MGAQVSQETGGKGDILTVRETDKRLPSDKAAGL